jgi:hypothetical protein
MTGIDDGACGSADGRVWPLAINVYIKRCKMKGRGRFLSEIRNLSVCKDRINA